MSSALHIYIAAAALGLAAFGSQAAFAQETAPDIQAEKILEREQRVFTLEDFADFQPQTASQMVGRIPGFTIQGDEGGERGFGQASLNLLINGRRPSSKSSSARDILGRIPADSVVRIEILDGASLDIPGLSGQVANIITKSTKISGNWEYAARFARDTEPQLREGNVSLTGERGNLEFVASLGVDQFTFTERGTEQFFDGDGVLFEDRQEQPYYKLDTQFGTLNLTWTPQPDHVANFNFAGQVLNVSSGVNEQFQAVTEAGLTGESELSGGEDEYNYEIGADYKFPALDGTLKLIGLYRFENSVFGNRIVVNNFGDVPTRRVFDRDDDEIEAILRAEYDFKPAKDHDLQISVEGALNILDSESRFSATGSEASLDDVRVEEDRAETNLTHSWAVSDRFNLQSSVGVEYSRLFVVTEDGPASKFVRPKGFVSASYNISPDYVFRSKVSRNVGQLDFGTFASSRSLSDNILNQGNRNIVPTQSWEGEVEIERKSPKGLSGTVKAFVERIEDPVDRILFINDPDDPDDDAEGPGNLDTAYLYGVEANATWVLDGIGFKGARIEFEGGLRDSQIEDPLTLQDRKINSTLNYFYIIGLRHDIPNTNYAWSIEAELDDQSRFFRLDQFSRARRDKPGLAIELEHKDFFGMRLEIEVSNLLNWDVERERQIFSPDRTGDLIRREEFARSRGVRLGIELSDTF